MGECRIIVEVDAFEDIIEDRGKTENSCFHHKVVIKLFLQLQPLVARGG